VRQLGDTEIDWFFWGPIKAKECSYTEAMNMPWDDFCELHEAIDYESDLNFLARKKSEEK
jgi:hypothetical protein